MTETGSSGPRPHRCKEPPLPSVGAALQATHANVLGTPLRPRETETG